MKRVLIFLLGSFALAIVLLLYTRVSFSVEMLSTLYTVAGVIFSVGMSITISPKTEGVTNKPIKKAIRTSYSRIRNFFIWFFSLDTILFIMAEGSFYPAFFNIWCGIFLLLSVVYYIINFISLQKLGEQIEDQVSKEMDNQ